LFLNQLDSFSGLEKLVAFYVEQHNSVMPHSAFKGQTPDEVFARTGHELPDILAAQRRTARQARIEENRKLSCEACFYAETQPAGLPPPS
jgi:hypothetical protein